MVAAVVVGCLCVAVAGRMLIGQVERVVPVCVIGVTGILTETWRLVGACAEMSGLRVVAWVR